MKISFIIVNYYTARLIEECIKTLNDNNSLMDKSYEIIIIDNSHSNKEEEKLNQLKLITDASIKIHCLKKNMGFGYANNVGVTLAKYENICFINSDVLVGGTNFNSLLKLLCNDMYGIVSCVIKNGDGSFQSAGFEIPNLNIEIRNNLLFENFSFRKKNRKYNNNGISEVGWISGAFFLIKKKIFNQIGGFDQNIFMYSEDLDISLQMRALTGKICVVDNSTSVIHNQNKKGYEKKLFETIISNKKNYYYVMEKHNIYGRISLGFVKLISYFNSLLIVSYKLLKGKN